jgi:hypothetical protein
MAPADSPQRKFIARAPRVVLTSLHRVRFAMHGPQGPIVLPVINISTSGLAFSQEHPPLPVPTVGSIFRGEVLFGDKAYAIALKVARINQGVIGCRYDGPADQLRQAVFAYLRVELAGLSAIKVDPKYHKQEPDGPTHWVHGDHCDLYYVEKPDGSGILRFRLTFLGHHFDGGQDSPLRFGEVVTQAPSAGPRMKGTELLDEKPVSPEMVQFALKFLASIAALPEAHRAGIAAYFKGSAAT